MSQWNQIRASFPAQPLVLFGPGKDSGTFDYFTLAIVGTQSSSRGDFTKSEDDMVIEHGVAGDPNALGYLGYAYYQAYKDQLKVMAVDNGIGCIVPSAAAVADGMHQPLSRPLFAYINLAPAARPEVKAFALFYVAPGSAQYVKAVGYLPLPTATLAAQASRLEKGVTGITFTWFDDDKERDRVRNKLLR
jgi:phosphate transport system substrate-binding protein